MARFFPRRERGVSCPFPVDLPFSLVLGDSVQEAVLLRPWFVQPSTAVCGIGKRGRAHGRVPPKSEELELEMMGMGTPGTQFRFVRSVILL